MDLDLTPEQEMLREMVRGVCSSYASLDTVRALEDDPVGFPAELWKQMAELDLIGLMVPARVRRLGDEPARRRGRLHGARPRARAVAALRERGDERGRAAARRGPTSRSRSGCRASSPATRSSPPRGWSPATASARAACRRRATADGDDFVLDGVKWHVPFASPATALVVLARTGDGETTSTSSSSTRTRRASRCTQQMTIASDTQYEVTLAGVRVPASARIGAAGSGWATWHDDDARRHRAARRAGDRRRAATRSTSPCSTPRTASSSTSRSARSRRSRTTSPTRSTAVDGAETLVYEAAWARADGRSIDRLAPMAKLFACKTFRDVTAMAQQVFGGVGFTLEYDIQLYFRRAKQLQISWWDDRDLEELIARCVLD